MAGGGTSLWAVDTNAILICFLLEIDSNAKNGSSLTSTLRRIELNTLGIFPKIEVPLPA
jgi:hypothetical protein